MRITNCGLDDRVSTAKEEVRKLLDTIPDEASFEDIQYHIYVRQKIEHGLEDVEAGRTVSEEEFDRRMAKWLEPDRPCL